MIRSLVWGAALGLLVIGTQTPADAGARKVYREAGERAHSKSIYYRRGPKVRGYVARRGGYSYDYVDSINTYGDSRSNYGAASSLRDPSLDRQSVAGPFDHGFFFDSGIGPRGGDSPYLN